MIEKVTELIIYEWAAGHTDVYMQEDGDQVTVNDAHLRWIKWKDIILTSEKYPAIDESLKNIEMLYDLIK
jgi:hypothetical protein